MKRTTRLTIETRRVIVIRRPEASRLARCEACGGPSTLVTADEAARLAQVSVRAIYRWVEGGHLHFIEASDESLLICVNSLLK